MSLKLRIDHGNLKFNLTSTSTTSVNEVKIQFDCFFINYLVGQTYGRVGEGQKWLVFG